MCVGGNWAKILAETLGNTFCGNTTKKLELSAQILLDCVSKNNDCPIFNSTTIFYESLKFFKIINSFYL